MALDLARELGNSVIVNCDSIQTYTKVEIGAAKPSNEAMKIVPHLLYSYVMPPRELTAGEYCRDFWEIVNSKIGEFSYFIVVGGTGFYFQAIEKGMYPVKAVSPNIMADLESRLSEEGAEFLHKELENQDPEAARRIHVNDHYRLLRALALIANEGKTVSEIKSQQVTVDFPFPLKKYFVTWHREELHRRIEKRTSMMIEAGLADEVRDLLSQGLREWSPLRSVGYKEAIEYLDGNISTLDMLVEKINISTRQLAKRQETWFKRDPDLSRVELSSAKRKIISDLLG